MKRYDFGIIIIVNKSPRIIWKKANEIENKEVKLETDALHKKKIFRKNQPRY